MALLEAIDEKIVQREAVKELRRYRSLKVKFENKDELSRARVASFFSSRSG